MDARWQSGPVSIEEINRQGPLILFSAGVYISEDREVIRFAQDYYVFSDGEERLREVEIVPKKYIIERKEWEVDPQ